jgi:hypothetical protein
MWKKIFFLSEYAYLSPSSLLIFNDAGFYLAGSVYRDTIEEWNQFFSKFDSNGDSVFFRVFTDSVNTGLYDMKSFSEDTIMLLGVIADTSVYASTTIMEVDTLGNIIHSLITAPQLKYPSQILKDSDRIYVGGTRRTTPDNDFNVRTYIDVYDNELNLLSIWDPNFSYNEYFGGFCLWNHQLYLGSLEMQENGPHPWQVRISQLNSSGGMPNYIHIGPIAFSVSNFTPQVLNHSYLIVGIVESSTELYFVDSSLDNSCSVTILEAGNYDRQLAGFRVLPDKRIAGTGYWFPADQSESEDHWDFLTENIENYVAGNCNFGTYVQENESEFPDFSLYPNPVQDELHISSSQFFTEIDIINQLGEVVKGFSFESKQKECTLSLSGLSIGIYLVRLVSEKGIEVKRIAKE